MTSSLEEIEARNRRGQGPFNLSWLNYNRYYNSIRDEENHRLDGGKENEQVGGPPPASHQSRQEQHYAAPPAPRHYSPKQPSQPLQYNHQAQAKFDMGLAREALQWIEQVTGMRLVPSRGAFTHQADVQEVLRDGVALARLMNTVFPMSIKRVNPPGLPFKERENIEMFVKACLANGMADMDLFLVEDLYEGRSIYSVINTIHSLGTLAQAKGWTGPVIGVRHSARNTRELSDETMAPDRGYFLPAEYRRSAAPSSRLHREGHSASSRQAHNSWQHHHQTQYLPAYDTM